MSQDVTSAPEFLEERAQHTVLLKRPAVVHGYAEGGGVLGLMFPVFGNDWEEKTGLPFGMALHVKDGVSTGMPFMTGISLHDPDGPMGFRYSCHQLKGMYKDNLHIMFAKKRRRLLNLATNNVLNLARRLMDPAKIRKDRAYIERIKKYCDLLVNEVPDDKRSVALSLRDTASQIWLTRSDVKLCLNLAKRITESTPANPKKKIPAYEPTENARTYASEIGFLLNHRSTAQKGLLSTLFTRATLSSMDTAQKLLGPSENRHHNPDIKQQLFRSHMGDTLLSELRGSIFTAAFSPRDMSTIHMFSRRENLVDMNPHAPVQETSHPDMKAWDANMATTANLLAFPPYITEAGVLMTDKAPIYTPGVTISQIEKCKPPGFDIISITLSTGHSVISDMDDKQLHDFYMQSGELGNELFLEEAKAATTTAWHKDLAARIGKKNIYYLSPRMTWKNLEEEREFPSSDITDASEENLNKIIRRAEKYLAAKQDEINQLWQTLADNMYLLGHIDKPKFDEITTRLGVKRNILACAYDNGPVQDNVLPFPSSTPPEDNDTVSEKATGTNQPPPKPIKLRL